MLVEPVRVAKIGRSDAGRMRVSCERVGWYMGSVPTNSLGGLGGGVLMG